MTKIFLGEPHPSIKQFIIQTYGGGSTGHAETIFTLQGGTVETYDITGTLDQQWFIDNGYFNDDNYQWTKTITQADIGNTITSIGSKAFQRCFNLTSVIIPDSVRSIDEYAFQSCTSLTNIMIPNSVTSIGEDAFYECGGLTSLTIGNSVTSIDNTAFYICSKITSVTIPDSVTSIGSYAFFGCSSLTIVTIVDNGGNAEDVKQMIIDAIDDTEISDNITWN